MHQFCQLILSLENLTDHQKNTKIDKFLILGNRHSNESKQKSSDKYLIILEWIYDRNNIKYLYCDKGVWGYHDWKIHPAEIEK